MPPELGNSDIPDSSLEGAEALLSPESSAEMSEEDKQAFIDSVSADMSSMPTISLEANNDSLADIARDEFRQTLVKLYQMDAQAVEDGRSEYNQEVAAALGMTPKELEEYSASTAAAPSESTPVDSLPSLQTEPSDTNELQVNFSEPVQVSGSAPPGDVPYLGEIKIDSAADDLADSNAPITVAPGDEDLPGMEDSDGTVGDAPAKRDSVLADLQPTQLTDGITVGVSTAPSTKPDNPYSVLDDVRDSQARLREERERVGRARRAREAERKMQEEIQKARERLVFRPTNLMNRELKDANGRVSSLDPNEVAQSLRQVTNLLRDGTEEQVVQFTYNLMTILDEDYWDELVAVHPVLDRYKKEMSDTVNQLSSVINDRYSRDMTPEERAEQRRRMAEARKEGEISFGQYVQFGAEALAETDVLANGKQFMEGFTGQLASEGLAMADLASALGDDFMGTLKSTWTSMKALKQFIDNNPQMAQDQSANWLRRKLTTPKGNGELVAIVVLGLIPGGAVKMAANSATLARAMATIASKAPKLANLAKMARASSVVSKVAPHAAKAAPALTGASSSMVRNLAKNPILNDENFAKNVKDILDTVSAGSQKDNPLFALFYRRATENPAEVFQTPEERADFFKLLSDMDAEYKRSGTVLEEHQRQLNTLYEQKGANVDLRKDQAFKTAMRDTLKGMSESNAEGDNDKLRRLVNDPDSVLKSRQEKAEFVKLITNIDAYYKTHGTIRPADQIALRKYSNKVA